jgi:hypothetical protein
VHPVELRENRLRRQPVEQATGAGPRQRQRDAPRARLRRDLLAQQPAQVGIRSSSRFTSGPRVVCRRSGVASGIRARHTTCFVGGEN